MNECTEQKNNVPTTTTGTTPPANLMSFLANIIPNPCVRTTLEEQIDLLKTNATKSTDEVAEIAALEATLEMFLLQSATTG